MEHPSQVRAFPVNEISVLSTLNKLFLFKFCQSPGVNIVHVVILVGNLDFSSEEHKLIYLQFGERLCLLQRCWVLFDPFDFLWICQSCLQKFHLQDWGPRPVTGEATAGPSSVIGGQETHKASAAHEKWYQTLPSKYGSGHGFIVRCWENWYPESFVRSARIFQPSSISLSEMQLCRSTGRGALLKDSHRRWRCSSWQP